MFICLGGFISQKIIIIVILAVDPQCFKLFNSGGGGGGEIVL
jgi:hypothetical protein